MGRLPNFVLRNRVTLTPYLGRWGAYGAPVPGIRCAVQQRIASSVGQAGVVRLLEFTLVAQLDEALGAAVEGSLVTLEDGRTGFISAVARHTAPGLPTPDHVEVGVEMAGRALPPALGGELVVILRRVQDGEDRYHNARYVTVEEDVPSAAVRPLSSTEQTSAQMGTGRDQLVDTIEVILPPDTDVTGLDRMRVRGLTYEVDGEPTDLRDSMTGADPGIRVIGKRVRG